MYANLEKLKGKIGTNSKDYFVNKYQQRVNITNTEDYNTQKAQ